LLAVADMMGEAAATPPETDAAPAAEAPQPVVTFAKKQRRGNLRKRAADDTGSAQLATVPDDSSVIRKQKALRPDNPMAFSTKKPVDEKLEPFTFESSRTLQQSTDDRATATLETETEFDRDARCGMASCQEGTR
jgi:RING finger protein 113A